MDERTKKSGFNPIWLKWFIDLVGVINASGGGSGAIGHNDTTGLQGGAANQFYHLDAPHYTFLNALTGTAAAHNLAASAIALGISATITTAKLTPGGTNGSMTFTNGILTAQTAAT